MNVDKFKELYPEKYKKLADRLTQMNQRCINPNNKKYQYYGGKGIKVCEEWLNNRKSFIQWCLDRGWFSDFDRPSIERIDSDKDYCPDNCEVIEHTENSGRSRRGKTKYQFDIFVYDIDGYYVDKCTSILDVRVKYNISLTHIKEIINEEHLRKSSNGYRLSLMNVDKLKPLAKHNSIEYTKVKVFSLYTIGGKFVKSYNSIQEASDELYIENRYIRNVLLGKVLLTQNKRFKYGLCDDIGMLETTKGIQPKYEIPILVNDTETELNEFLSNNKDYNRNRVLRVLRGERKTYKGMTFKYI